MSSDPNKKSPRTFQCRDILWDAFQQMAQELECSVDYLINESMKQYARQRYAGRTAQRGNDGVSPSQTPGGEVALSRSSPSLQPPQRASNLPAPATNPLPPPPARTRSYSNVPPPPPPQGRGGFPAPSRAPGPPPPMNSPRSVPPPLPRGGPVPPPPSRYGGGSGGYAPAAAPAAAPAGYAGQLSVVYAGERVAVNKDRFIIGRGKQSSDLTIKDPNVSRQHAMIEFLNGQYYMVDMGSTNGVEYNGQRISRRPIAEGDIYRICDHEVRLTYR
ncbi:MAG TPA: FHA domain-containing protein [Polyangiaceae bacterium]|nr:FHA domain-containing protein [Polyangiaceae bacterium]